THTFKVKMACSGCSGAVTKALGRVKGVEKVDIDMDNQKVIVTGTAPHDTILEAIRATGKEAHPDLEKEAVSSA
ncbi:heavy-metal-associated domain-containing protein, partial [Dimargaris cristalligena]